MYSDRDLANEVKKAIGDILDAGRDVAPEWIAHGILSKRTLVATGWADEDREFYWLCASTHVRNEVTRLLREFKRKTDLGKWSKQPGFAFIQRAYMVEHRGRQRIVPLSRMTKADGLQKIIELFAMAEGATAHARELMRYFGFTDGDLLPRAA